jgi:hypothetical protein
MKLLAAILLVSSISIQAQNLRSLKDVMSDMGAIFKTLTIAITAGTINPKIIEESAKLVTLVKESEAITPDTILSLPNVDQAAAKAKYDQELKDLENNATALNVALASNNIDQAKVLLTKLTDGKKQGHKDFK